MNASKRLKRIYLGVAVSSALDVLGVLFMVISGANVYMVLGVVFLVLSIWVSNTAR